MKNKVLLVILLGMILFSNFFVLGEDLPISTGEGIETKPLPGTTAKFDPIWPIIIFVILVLVIIFILMIIFGKSLIFIPILLVFLLIFILTIIFGKSTVVVILIGGLVGGFYGIGPWIAGIFRSLDILIMFAFSNVTILVFHEMLGIENYNLAFGLSIVLWILVGVIISIILNKIRIKLLR